MGTSGIVVKYGPSLATINGVDNSKLCARTAAVADGEVQLQVAQRCRRHRHLKILVVLRAVRVVALSRELVDRGRIQAQVVIGGGTTGTHLPLAVAGMDGNLTFLRHQRTFIGQKIGLQRRPLRIGQRRPP